jgi:hypothetical protein
MKKKCDYTGIITSQCSNYSVWSALLMSIQITCYSCNFPNTISGLNLLANDISTYPAIASFSSSSDNKVSNDTNKLDYELRHSNKLRIRFITYRTIVTRLTIFFQALKCVQSLLWDFGGLWYFFLVKRQEWTYNSCLFIVNHKGNCSITNIVWNKFKTSAAI